MKYGFTLAIFLCFGLGNNLNAQLNADLKLIPRTDSVQVGQPLHLKIQLTLPANGQCNAVQLFPDSIRVMVKAIDPQDSSAVSYEVLDYGQWDRAGDFNFLPRHLNWVPQKNASTQLFQNEIKIVIWEPGVFVFPAVKADITLSSGNYEVFSNEFPFAIGVPDQANITNVDSTGLAPIKSIEREGAKNYAWLIAGILTGAALLFGLIYLLANRKKKPVDIYIPPALAHETAFKALADLEKRKDWEKNLLKKYYDELTLIIRKYLEDRYEIKALESTTDEIFRDLTKINLSADLQTELKKLLPMTDMVKFAKADPSGESHVNWLNWAKNMVEQTKEEPNLEIENNKNS